MTKRFSVSRKTVDSLLATDDYRARFQSARVIPMSVKPLQRAESLSSQVYREIERIVMSGQLEPGSKVNEYTLAEQLGVSRGPVREATRALVQAGLLVAVPARGVFVRELSEVEIAENYDVRALLTGLMCARAAERRTDAAIAELNRLIGQMDDAISKRAIVDYYRANLTFHSLIAKVADHACSTRIYDDLIRETHFLRRSLHAPAQTNEEHREMVSAIADGDVEHARRIGEEHVFHGKRRWRASLDEDTRQTKTT
mgnify:CR=1 FL=1|tara:strand:+ start:4403 stop:5170 length:768 start_codon:yes stop_codon:yes gene_type:complete